MYDLSKFIRMSKTFPRNIDKTRLQNIQQHFITRKAQALRFSIVVYLSPLAIGMYYVWSRKTHRYYQIFPQKEVQLYMPDYAQDDVVRSEKTLNNVMPYNQI